MGTTRVVHVDLLVVRVVAVVELGELPRRFKQVGDLHWRGRVGRLLEDQKQPRPTGQIAFRVMPQSVIANPMKSTRQNVRQEPSKELHARQSRGAPDVGVAILVAETNVRVVHAENPRVADRRAIWRLD